jgi:tetratricopeptide (TPR) repeat protein
MEWRKEVIDFALDQETRTHIDEQMAWIAREPENPRPYYHLAQLYRMQWKQEEGLALLLQAIRLDETFAPAHAALAEIYAVRADYAAAWRHARAAESLGEPSGVDLLRRHGIAE